MFSLFTFSGFFIQQDLGSEAQDKFVPLTVLQWMFSPSTPVVFPITAIFTLMAVGSVAALKFYPGFQSTSLTVANIPVAKVVSNVNKSSPAPIAKVNTPKSEPAPPPKANNSNKANGSPQAGGRRR
jgi:hypothetical protein